jgi:cystathionine gamma-synthase
MAAITTLAMTLRKGDRVIIPNDVYGGTFRLFDKVLSGLGLEYATAEMTDLAALDQALEGGARLILAESPTNPLLKILDISALAERAHAAGALLAVDNTFATPYIQRPLDLGADVCVYSATKYLGGHSDLVVGSLATSDLELVERLRFLQNSIGAIPGPFDSWLLLRGLKTLGLRMRAHSAGAARVAAWLTDQPQVERVFWPGFQDSPGHSVATRQMAAAGEPLYGGMVSVEMESEQAALDLCARTKLFFLAESLGGVESLIEHPGKMTHASLAGSGMEVSAALVRLSVGIEHPDDLIEDLAAALRG